MPDLLLLRHGQSQWNLENRFTGWIDVPLSPRGEAEARAAGEKLRGRKIDKLYTSVLVRATETARLALEAAGIAQLPTECDAALNERMYGELQGMNKAEAAARFGAEQVKLWRRSYDGKPPGGASGIGAATVRAYAAEGAHVASLDVNDDAAGLVAAEGRVRHHRCDVSRRQDVDEVFARVVDALGGLDVLVHAAGIERGAPAEEITEEDWDRVFAVN